MIEIISYTGMTPSPLIYQSGLCDDPNFDRPVWMTQARKLKYTFYIFILISF